MRQYIKRVLAMMLAFVLVFAFSSNQYVSADGGGKVYRYRFDLPKEQMTSDYTKLGIVMFPGDSLMDESQDVKYEQDGCEYNSYYMGFQTGSVDTSMCNATKRTTEVQTGKDKEQFEGVSGLAITGERPVIVDGGDITTSGPYQIMVDGKMIQHNTVLYKIINMHVMGDYNVIYDLDGGVFEGEVAQTSFTPGKEDTTYKVPAPTKKGYRFCGWKPDSRTVAIDVEGVDTLVIKGVYDSDEESMQGKIRQANALYNNGGYTVTASWDKLDEDSTEATTEETTTEDSTEDISPDVKSNNTLSVKGKTASVKYSKLKKKAQTLAANKVITFADKGKGALSYAKVNGSKKINVDKKTGKITVKKGVKKGTYKLTVKVKASGNASYKASAWKKVTLKIVVK